MKQQQQALDWAKQYFNLHKKATIVRQQRIVDTAYSVVYKLETTDGVTYLKQTPKTLFLEARTLDFLSGHDCKNIPVVLAKNEALNCFLMADCGENTLRQLFNGKVDVSQLMSGFANYVKIQWEMQNKTQLLLALGIPDWRINKFAGLYYQLIQKEPFLLKDGLTHQEIKQLQQSYPLCVELCEKLAELKMPETLNHCDFHENNMLLDKNDNNINIIDWTETVIAHPFFSLQCCLWNLTYFYKLKESSPEYTKLQSFYIEAWRIAFDEKTLLNALNLTYQLSGIFAALAYERIYEATENQSKKVQEEHPGSIAGCLRTFYSKSILSSCASGNDTIKN